jgi:hypothetical protein
MCQPLAAAACLWCCSSAPLPPRRGKGVPTETMSRPEPYTCGTPRVWMRKSDKDQLNKVGFWKGNATPQAHQGIWILVGQFDPCGLAVCADHPRQAVQQHTGRAYSVEIIPP